MFAGPYGGLRVRGKYWLSASDIHDEGSFFWCSNSTARPLGSYTQFAAGQPDNAEEDENCLVFDHMMQLSDENCANAQNAFICKVRTLCCKTMLNFFRALRGIEYFIEITCNACHGI